MAYENFLADYTEVDPDEKITLTSTRTSWDDITDGADAYVYCDKGVDHFNGAYNQQLEIYYADDIPCANVGFWALTNILSNLRSIDTFYEDYEEYLSSNGSKLSLSRINAGARVFDDWDGFVRGTVYYVTIKRTAEGVLTAKIRTGSHTGVLQDTLQVTGAETAYRYIHSFNHFREISGHHNSGYTQNLDLEPFTKYLAGTCAIKSTAVASTISRTRALAGTTACATAVTGNIKAIRGISRTTRYKSRVIGELTKMQVKELAGTVTISSVITGELTRDKALAGTSSISTLVEASITRTREIAGTIAITSVVTGELLSITKLAGVVVISSAVTGELIKVIIKSLAGTVDITSSVIAEIKSINYLAGTTSITCSVVGQIKVVYKLAGTVVITSTAIGTLWVPGTKELSGIVAIKSTVTGILVVYYGYQLLPPFMQKDVIDPYSGGAWLWLVEIVIPTQATQRIACNTEDVRYGGEDYLKGNFIPGRQKLSGDASIPRIILRVAQDEAHTLEAIVNATKGGEGGTVKLIRTCEKYLEQPAAALQADYDILTAGSDYQWITFVLGMPDLLTQRFPLWLYSSKVCPLATPSLFKGPRCQLDPLHADTTCTGLFEDCRTKGNAHHWGGEIGLDPAAVRI